MSAAGGYRAAVGWNFLSTLFSGICGFVVLLVMGGVYGSELLGVFNQVYAFYIVCSQFAAFGIHLSLAKHLAEHEQDGSLRRVVLSSGFLLSFVVALFFSSLLWLSRGAVGYFFSPRVGFGVGIVSLGVFFFSLNKSLLYSLNGMRFFKEYALFQSLRFFFMLGTLVALIVLGVDGVYTPGIFPVAEGLLFLCLVVFCRRDFCFAASAFPSLIEWGRRHLFFGLKSSGGHILLLVNTRIDVLFLGFFTDDRSVGIYSMAAIVAEASCQLPTVFRTVYTPDIVKFVAERRVNDLAQLVRRSRLLLWGTMFVVAIVGYSFIDLALPVLTGRLEYSEAASLFLVLMVGVVVASGYMPFGFILLNGGYPGVHSLMMLLLVLLNCAGNLWLVPLWGGIGAAWATSFANVCSLLLLKSLTRRYLDIAI